MESLEKHVRRAQRRLNLQRFLGVLTWCWFAALSVTLVLVVVDKYWPLGLTLAAWVALALGAGFAAAVAWTWWNRDRQLTAAIELDRRFGLKERVSTSLSLTEAEQSSEAGQLLLADTQQRVSRIDVGERFGIQLGRWTWLPVAPATLAVMVALFFNPIIEPQEAVAKNSQTAAQKRINKSTEVLSKRVQEKRRRAEELGLQDAEALLEQLEQGTRQLSEAQQPERKQSLVELNELSQNVEQRRQQLGSADEMRERLEQLKDIKQGPADELAGALRKGDLGQAMEAIEKLKQQLEDGELTEEQQAELGEQLEQMADKLNQMLDAQRQLEESLAEQIQQEMAAGNQQRAEQLQEQLNQLQQQRQQMEQMSQMADRMAECAQCMKGGQTAEAMQQLEALAGDLEQLAQQLEEMELLDDVLDQISQAKNSMGCKECGGAGCPACQGAGRQQSLIAGRGMGEGEGQGDRPEAEDDTGFYDSQVRQQVGQGAAVITDLVGGPNAKGRVSQQIQSEFESAGGEDTNPLTDQKLPRGHRDHARDYFEALREGR
mgnify:FL=1